MIPLAKVTDHAAQALDVLVSQFDGAPRLRKLVEILAGEVQRWEDWQWLIWQRLQLDTNTIGWWLDLYGRIVELARLDAESDDRYRELLDVAILAFNSKTLAETIIEIAYRVIGEVIYYRDTAAGWFELQYTITTGLSAIQAARLGALIQRAKRPGAGWRLVEGSTPSTAARYEISRYEISRYARVIAGSSL